MRMREIEETHPYWGLDGALPGFLHLFNPPLRRGGLIYADGKLGKFKLDVLGSAPLSSSGELRDRTSGFSIACD